MAEIKRFDIPVSAPEFRVSSRSGTTRSKRTGSVMREVAVATYAPSAGDSGAAGSHGTGVYLPANAVIMNVWYDVVTTFTSATDAATIALGYTGSTAAFTAALAISDASNIWDAGLHATKIGNFSLDGNSLTQIDMAAARAATYAKVTAEKQILVTNAVETLTAGKINIYVEYVISD